MATGGSLAEYLRRNKLALAANFFMSMQVVLVVGMLVTTLKHQLTHQSAVFFFSREIIATSLFGLCLFLGRKQNRVGRTQFLMLAMPMAMLLVIYSAASHS
jgi:hypothetical protein